jgi:hypothetical protein
LFQFRNLAILIALAFIPAAWGQQLPPVYFNHASLTLDKATLDDLAASPFLRDEFKLLEQTTQRDGGKWSYTGMYVLGRGTYLEFLPAAVEGQPPVQGTDPLGSVGFGMWIDDRSQLPLIRDRIAGRTHLKSEIQTTPYARRLLGVGCL